MDIAATGDEAKVAYDNLTDLWAKASTEDPGPCLHAIQIPSFFTLSPSHQFLATCMEY
jgi:hypothetical protein